MKIGIDIISTNRMQSLINRFGEKALRRFLSEDEIKLAKNINTISGFWAAKEAFSKALGTGIGKECGFLDITIYKNQNGMPLIKLSPKIKSNFNIKSTSLSITHDNGFAVAAVVVV